MTRKLSEYQIESWGRGQWHPLPGTYHSVDKAIGIAQLMVQRAAMDEPGYEGVRAVRVKVLQGKGVVFQQHVPDGTEPDV